MISFQKKMCFMFVDSCAQLISDPDDGKGNAVLQK